MPETNDATPPTEFVDADLTGARFEKTHLNDAVFRMVELTGASIRDSSLSDVSIDGSEIDGLTIDGVEIAPLIEAELTRRNPARALRFATDPDGLRDAWAAAERSWAATDARVAAMPAGTTDTSVKGEWSYAQTLRHLVSATDTWLGPVLGIERPFHPWGVPFSDITDFADPADLGIDVNAMPSFDDVLEMRAGRVAMVRDFLSDVTPERLAEECAGPFWSTSRTTVLRCIRVILNEESDHLHFATRDLDLIEASSPR